MQTKVLRINADRIEAPLIEEAGQAIADGKLVAFPTETVYGLGASILNEDALRRVYEVKQRPFDKPLSVQIADVSFIHYIADDISDKALKLINALMPGPITVIVKASASLSPIITANTGKVGIRIPNHPVALRLIEAAGVPIVAPSANTSGLVPPTNADMVLKDIGGKIEYVIDSGPSNLKIASTVIDTTGSKIIILREGAISEAKLRAILES